VGTLDERVFISPMKLELFLSDITHSRSAVGLLLIIF